MRSLTHTVALNTIFTLLGKLSVKVLAFAFTIFIARFLGEADFGRYALIWSYVTVFAAASDFGLGMYLIRELARNPANRQRLIGNVIVFRLAAALTTLGLIGLSIRFTNYTLPMMGHIVLAATILLLYAVQDPLDSILQAEERLGFSSFSKIFGQLIYIASGAIFLLAGWGITGLILASLGNILATAVLVWHLVEKQMGGIRWQIQPRLWPGLLMAALPFGLIGLALNWSQKIDTVILSLYWPAETIGWYNAAYNLILSAVILSNAFNIAFFPSMTKETNQQKQLTARKIYGRVCKYLFTFSLPLAVGLSILSQPIVLTLYGPTYAPAAAPLAILAWTIPLIFLSEFLRYMHLVSGLEKKAARLVIIVVLGNIILNLIFIPLYGLTAASIITVLTEAVLVILYLWQLQSHFPLKMALNTFWKPTVAGASMAGVMLITRLPLLVEMGLGLFIFGGMLSLLRFLETEEKLIVCQVLSRLLSNP